MAIIGKIRQRSWILVGFIALALFIFILEAALDRNSLFSGGGDSTVGEVDGAEIPAKEYSDNIAEYEEGLKMINPSMQITDEVRTQIQDEVWSSILAKRLLEGAIQSLGLSVSTSEMGELMWGDMPHPLAQRFLMNVRQVKPDIIDQQTGQINQGKIREFISNIDQIDQQNKTNFRQMLSAIEKLIQDDQVKQKYASLVSQSFYMPTFMAKEVVNSGRAAKVGVVSVPYTSLPDDKYKVTDAQINEYIKNHAALFEQEAARVVDVVAFDVVPSADDTAEVLQKINTLRNDYLASLPNDSAFIARNSQQGAQLAYYSKEELAQTVRNADTLFSLPVGTLTNVYTEGNYYLFTKIIDRKIAPDTVRAAHILLSLGQGTEADKKAANTLADSLIRVINSNQKTFGQVAVENSLDEGSKNKGGDLGYFSRGQMVPEFNDQVFYKGMAPGQIAKVETGYGLHIILLIDAKAPKAVTKFADFVVELVPGNETEKLAYDQAVDFQQKNQTAADFDKSAKSQRLIKNVVLSKNMSQVPQLGSARKLVQWAFQQEKAGVVDFFDTENTYLVAKLSKIVEKGLPKADDVREEVTALVRNELKAKDLIEQLNKAGAGTTDLAAIAAKVKDAMVTDTVLIRFSSAFVQGVGNEPKLVGASFGVPVGKTSKAMAGERVVFMVQPKSVEENVPEMEGDIELYKKQMQQMFISRLNFQSIFESISKKAKVEDTRYKFY
ncbi:MAG TPA: peptidylprolyl isomerase [Chitinophagales bacterium]|nr:peptidylprolyl isomerase [Chitinophagales bacterium]